VFDYISGSIVEAKDSRAVIDAGGIGYELFCSSKTLDALHWADRGKLYVHFHLAQHAFALYGFKDAEQRAMLRRLISVTRIGPKAALAILSDLSVSDVALAIATANPAAFDKVSGVGRKTAARITLELKEKITSEQIIPSLPSSTQERNEAVAALVALGYDGMTASKAVLAAEGDTVEKLLSSALRSFARD
jgi:Holliday junction DNA helicase RuvA